VRVQWLPLHQSSLPACANRLPEYSRSASYVPALVEKFKEFTFFTDLNSSVTDLSNIYEKKGT
jgi:hypothetical protein